MYKICECCGKPKKPQAIISSPPYGETISGGGEGPGARHDFTFHSPDNATKKSSQAAYGETAGQLGGMAVVGSPPFASGYASEQSEEFYRARGKTGKITGTVGQEYAESRVEIYNPYTYMSPEWLEHRKQTAMNQNIGRLPEDAKDPEYPTFWSEAKKVVEQCYQLLPPGGVAVWVTGNFRRDYKVVDFGSQWLSLCESVGFVGLEKIIAWKSEPRPAQADIFGNIHDRDIHRVSFFRRLDNQKHPGNEILSEEVWIVQKPVSLL